MRAQAGSARPAGPVGLPRLWRTGPPEGLAGHLDRHRPIPFRGRVHGGGTGHGVSRRGEGLLIDSIERAGLTGRGGAGFPVARKMRAVLDNVRATPAGLGRAVVVANGVESEPLSAKDRSLLAASPHLVLDGISLAAESVSAGEAFLCVDADEQRLCRRLAQAIAVRREQGIDPVPIRVVGVPAGYVSSEESALVHLLNGGAAVPTFVPPRPFVKGVRGRPTLVNNVETLAHVALVARYGPAWFRSLGTPAAPGSALITVAGAVRAAGVVEIALGTGMRDVLAAAGGATQPPQAILAGGYFGTWLPATSALDLPVSGPDLRAAGASLGAGILAVLPESACGVAETARIARYLAGQSAGQCGPCVNGLPAIADALEHIAWWRSASDTTGNASDAARHASDAARHGRAARSHQWLVQLLKVVEGRGACHFPDGAVRLVASALRVFSADLRLHLRHGPCDRARRAPVLLLPGPGADGGQADRRERTGRTDGPRRGDRTDRTAAGM